jgi:hypothetical protein
MNELKKCRCCGLDYPLDGFSPSRVNKDGRISYCKKCNNEKAKQRSGSRHFTPRMDGVKTCRTCHRELSILDFGVAHHLVDGRNSECSRCANERARRKDRSKGYEWTRSWKKKNKEKIKESFRQWRMKNIEHVRQAANHRYATDLDYRMKAVLRARIHAGIRGRALKSDSTMRLLGCSIEELKAHLKKMFVTGMSWDNYGEWEIDHIMPCSSFNLELEDEQRRCFNFSNLQPLWSHDNRVKFTKIPAMDESQQMVGGNNAL